MSWLRHMRQQRWSVAWIAAATLSVYLAYTGVSSMIGRQLLPVGTQENPTHTAETSLPNPEQLFTSKLAPSPASEISDSKAILSIEVGKFLKQAQEFALHKQFHEALEMIRAASALPDKTPYDRFIIREMLAYVAVNLNDYLTAAQAYEDNLASGFLSADEYLQHLKTLVTLHYQLKDFAQVKKFGQLYLDKYGYNAEVLLLMAQADYLRKDYASAAELASTLIEQSGAQPKEDWLRLLMSCQHNLGQRNAVVATLTKLLALYPAPGYWKDLYSHLSTTPGMTDRFALETYRLKIATIGLQAADYVEMAEIAMALGLPGEAESVLQQGFNAKLFGTENTSVRETRLLALAQQNAAEDREALASIDTRSRSSAAGYDSIKLGEAYLSYGKYDQAIDAINRGLNKGNFAEVGEAQLHLGIALAKLNLKERARAAFNAVPKNSALHPVAKVWVAHLGKT